MNDAALISLFAGLLDAALAAESVSIPVIQANQPTQQSRTEDGEGVYFQILFTQNYGFPLRTQSFNQETGVFDTIQTQQMVTKIQVSVFYPADVTDDTRATANDLASRLCMRMQSDKTISTLRAAGAGITRITQVRHPFFDNDQDQAEYVPNFDMDINYNRVLDDTVQKVVSFEGIDVHGV